MTGLPNAAPIANLIGVSRAWDGCVILTVDCCYCHRPHTHGGGLDLDKVDVYLGHRQSHCGDGFGYVITDRDEILDAQVDDLRGRRLPRRD